MKNFFISYNKADRRWAEWVAWYLEEAYYSTVLQAWDFRPGSNFVLEMQKAASESEHTIAILTTDYLNSLFTQPEWAAAFTQDPNGEKSNLIPVRVKKCALKGILSSIVYIDLVDKNERDAKAALLKGIQRNRIKPTVAPNFPGAAKGKIGGKPSFPGTLPPPPGEKLETIWNVPQRRNPNFSGREEVLSKLADDLNSGQPAALTQTIAGLGGIGKTQIALEFAYRNRSKYKAVWWLRAEEAETLAADYAAFAKAANLPEKAAQEEQIIIDAVRCWLEQNGKWLFIFDNAQKPEDIHDYLPRESTGHIIITSRHQAWAKLGHSFSIDTWSRSESVEFLFKRTKDKDRPSARSVAEALGDLPLALEQAAAYINETGIGFNDYLKLFQTRRNELWNEEKPPLNYPDSVGTTWSLAIEKVQEKEPTGVLVLNLCSYFASDEIPRSLMSDASEYLPDNLSPLFKDTIALNRGIKALNHYSLIISQPDSLSIHRLVQALVQDRLSTEEQKLWVEVAVRAVNAVFPDDSKSFGDPNSWPKCIALLSHGRVGIEYAIKNEAAIEEVSHLLNKIASYLYGRAAYSEAEPLFRRALEIRETQLEDNQSEVATSLNNLASLLQAQGKYAEAEPLFRRALEIRETQLEDDQSEVATNLNNLAVLLQAQGKYSKAEPLMRRALEIRETQLGADHPSVATSLNNLASLLQDQGKYSEAEPLMHRALEIRETQLSADHPAVATSLNNLASLLQDQGKYSEAEPLFRRALEIRETQLDAVHPSVATSLNNLALLLQAQGKYSEAEPLFRRALEIAETQLGRNHPFTNKARNHLEILLSDMKSRAG